MKAIENAGSTPAGERQIPTDLPSWPARWLEPASAVRIHWLEYGMEAAELGSFMVSACLFAALLAMGLTAIAIIYSPWGKQSGAHLNPAITLSFVRLGRVSGWGALFYVGAQFLGGVAGVGVASLLLGRAIAHESVNYAVTRPGRSGTPVAFVAELVSSFVFMTVVLAASNSPRMSRFTGIFAGVLVATYVALEAPYSGMSMNPARTFGSAFHAHFWSALWIYFTAPPLSMLLASELFVRVFCGARSVICAKLHHNNNQRCIFHCGYRRAALETNSDMGMSGRKSAAGPGVELLEHLSPRTGSPNPMDVHANDITQTETRMAAVDLSTEERQLFGARAQFVSLGAVAVRGAELGFRQALTVLDPDDHTVRNTGMS